MVHKIELFINHLNNKPMQLKDLQIGQKFFFANDEKSKTWEKLSNNGDITIYNTCICITDLLPEEKSGLMLIASWKKRGMDKYAEVVILK